MCTSMCTSVNFQSYISIYPNNLIVFPQMPTLLFGCGLGAPSVHVNSLLPLQHGSLLVPRHHSSPASDAHCFVAIAVVLLPFPSMALLPSLDQISTGLLLQLLISTLTLPSCLHCLTNFSVNVSTDTRHSFFLFLFLRIGYESL
jgi:hypothetical protein